jgi:hypothetical protein
MNKPTANKNAAPSNFAESLQFIVAQKYPSQQVWHWVVDPEASTWQLRSVK